MTLDCYRCFSNNEPLQLWEEAGKLSYRHLFSISDFGVRLVSLVFHCIFKKNSGPKLYVWVHCKRTIFFAIFSLCWRPCKFWWFMTTENTYKCVSQMESKKKKKKLSCTFRYSCPYCQHQLIANLFKNVYCGQRIDVCICRTSFIGL